MAPPPTGRPRTVPDQESCRGPVVLTQDGSVAVVLIPLPAQDFDPTEVAVSWKVLSSLGHEVRFATPAATPAEGDALMVTGQGLDPWSPVPGLARFVGIGRLLAADGRARAAYDELVSAPPSSILSVGTTSASILSTACSSPAATGTRHAPLSRERRAPRTGRRRLHRRAPRRCDLPRCAARGSQHEPGDRSIRPLRQADDGAHLVPRAAGLAGGSPHPVLGPGLLPHLRGGGRPACGLHVGRTGGDPGARATRGLLGRGARDP